MPALPDPPYSLTTLDNGLRVVVSEDHLAPVVAVNIWYGVGSRYEQPGRTGFAHLFEHLMFQGSAHVGRGEHFQVVNGVGGTLNGTTWCDRTNYYETLPSHHLATALWLEADRMGGLLDALDQANLDNQRDVVKNEKRQSYDNRPYGQWQRLIHENAWPASHPYHHATIGSMADLDAATLEDARSFYATWYAPDNAVLSIVGDVDTAAALELVRHYFGGLAARGGFPAPPATDLDPVIGHEVRVTVGDRVPVPRAWVSYRIPPYGTKGYDAAVVLGVVLGGGRGSRLYKRLVLDDELLQPAGGDIMGTWPLVGGAVLIADLPARDGVAIETLEAAFHDEVATVADGIGADELERARAMVTSEVLHHLETVDGRADAFSEATTLFGDPGWVAQVLPRLLAVTADEVVEAAKSLLRQDNRVVVTIVPGEQAETEPVEGDATDDGAEDDEVAA